MESNIITSLIYFSFKNAALEVLTKVLISFFLFNGMYQTSTNTHEYIARQMQVNRLFFFTSSTLIYTEDSDKNIIPPLNP